MRKGRPLTVNWENSEQELYERYVAENDVVRKQRLQFFWLVRSGKTIRESCHIAGFKERVGQRYMQWYREDGLEKTLKRRHGGARKNQNAMLSEQQQEELKEAANEGAIKTVWEGIEWVKEKFNIQYSYEGMRSMYKRIGLKKKVPRKQHIKSNPDAQVAWKKGVWSTY